MGKYKSNTTSKKIVPLSSCHKSNDRKKYRAAVLKSTYEATISFSKFSTLNIKSFQVQGLSNKIKVKSPYSDNTDQSKKSINPTETPNRYVEVVAVHHLPNVSHPPTVEDYNGGSILLADAAQLGTLCESQVYFFGVSSSGYSAVLDVELKKSGSIGKINTRFVDNHQNPDEPLSLNVVVVLNYLELQVIQ